MPDVEAALRGLERGIRYTAQAWNTAEGRRGRIADNRKAIFDEQAAIEAQKESLRQEQWRLRKDAATFQHARDDADALRRQVELLTGEREDSRKELRGLLSKVKAVRDELRP